MQVTELSLAYFPMNKLKIIIPVLPTSQACYGDKMVKDIIVSINLQNSTKYGNFF